MEYLTRRGGARHWTQGYFSSASLNFVRYAALDAQLSPDRGRIVTVVDICRRRQVYVEAISAGQTRPPTEVEPALAGANYPCQHDRPYDVYMGIATLPHRKATVLLDSDSSEPAGGPLVSTGTPGKPFPAPEELPNPGHLATIYGAITRDPVTGVTMVVAYADTQPGGTYIWTQHPGRAMVSAKASGSSHPPSRHRGL